jgi:hypothetical protein
MKNSIKEGIKHVLNPVSLPKCHKAENRREETRLPLRAKRAIRMPFIDNLRVFLTIMVVVFHLAITYGATGSWFIERPDESPKSC